MVVGADISELLIKNGKEFPYDSSKNPSIACDRQSDKSESRQSTSYDNLDEDVKSSESELLENVQMNEEEITEKFRNYLLYGSVTEALDWATDNNLWGHALFLASKVDRRSHANVMMKFANKLTLNDPLQTLYQMMSGRTPSSVTVSFFFFYF